MSTLSDYNGVESCVLSKAINEDDQFDKKTGILYRETPVFRISEFVSHVDGGSEQLLDDGCGGSALVLRDGRCKNIIKTYIRGTVSLSRLHWSVMRETVGWFIEKHTLT